MNPSSSARLAFTTSVAIIFTNCLVMSQTVTSPVVGFVSQSVEPGSDTVLKVGFQQAPVFSGRLAGDPIDLGNSQILLLNGTPLGGSNSFAETHFVQVTSGLDEGAVFPISSNSSDQIIILAQAGDHQLAQDDSISVIPWWNLETLIPSAEQPDEQKASGNLPPDRRLELYLYTSGDGVGLSPSRIFFLSDSGWKESVRGFPDAGNVIISPSAVMILRSRGGGDPWKVVTSGTVNRENAVTLIETRSDKRQDTMVGLNRPVSVVLSEMGLNDESVFRSSSSTDIGDRQDELHVLDNGGTGINRPAAAIYFRVSGQWREDTPGFPLSDSVEISAESGLIIRKAPTADGEPVVWVNEPNYP